MAVSEDHASCWAHKDLSFTKRKIQAFLTAARALGRKVAYEIRMTRIEKEYWIGADIGRLNGNGFRGIVTAGEGSGQKGGGLDDGSRVCQFEEET